MFFHDNFWFQSINCSFQSHRFTDYFRRKHTRIYLIEFSFEAIVYDHYSFLIHPTYAPILYFVMD